MTRRCLAWLGMGLLDSAWHSSALLGMAWYGIASLGVAWLARPGSAVVAWLGVAWFDLAQHGLAGWVPGQIVVGNRGRKY
jgi:hypothetical protein